MELSDARQKLRDRLEDESVTDAKIDGYLNDAAKEMARAFDWPWLAREFHFSLRAKQSTTDATFTLDSRVVTIASAFGSTPFGHTLVTESGRVFRVINVDASATKIHLDYPWPDATTSTEDADVLNDEIAMPRGVKSLRWVSLNDGSTVPVPITSVPQDELRDNDVAAEGRPDIFATFRRVTLPPPLVAPTGATSGTGLTGIYKYWQTYWDPETGGESRLSPALTTATLSNNGYRLTPATRQDFGVRYYRSRSGGSTPYFLIEQTSPTDTYVDATADAHLGERVTDDPSQLYVRFWPVPDQTYQIAVGVNMLPPELSEDTDVLPIPEEDVSIWMLGAEAVALRAVREWSAAQDTRNEFMRLINDMKQRHNENRTGPWILAGRRERPRRIVITTTS